MFHTISVALNEENLVNKEKFDLLLENVFPPPFYPNMSGKDRRQRKSLSTATEIINGLFCLPLVELLIFPLFVVGVQYFKVLNI